MPKKGFYWAAIYVYQQGTDKTLAYMEWRLPRTKDDIRKNIVAGVLESEPDASHLTVDFYDDWGREDDNSPTFSGRSPFSIESHSVEEWKAIIDGYGE